MPVDLKVLEALIFKTYDTKTIRFLQSSPIYPAVWLDYVNAEKDKKKSARRFNTYHADLILTPHNKSSAAEVFHVLHDIGEKPNLLGKWELATNGETVAAKLTFTELLCIAMPLAAWWSKTLDTEKEILEKEWLHLVIGAVLTHHEAAKNFTRLDEAAMKTFRTRGIRFFKENKRQKPPLEGILWSVSMNRKASLSVQYSVPCTKADAGRRLFDIDGCDITWAVVDSGIDAFHPAFRNLGADKKILPDPFAPKAGANDDPNQTRIIATYDFTGFRDLISSMVTKRKAPRLLTSSKQNIPLGEKEKQESMESITAAVKNGRMLDWTILGPLLRIPHNQKNYRSPQHPHGTHVAGIIGAGLTTEAARPGDPVLVGMCPRISLYDFRVLDQDGRGDEFNIIAALQFIRWINQYDGLNIHGVNLSMSIPHDVKSFACGETPVCISANRLVEEGVVVVAAAGNQGQSVYQSDQGTTDTGFRTVNITDPGNAEDVITVGATHRNEPHRYGVSFFSSKGPTGDGRLKPDVVAPGEKISSAVLNEGIARMDGTSMAAPHVSGAAALIMSKHKELIGRPRRIKDILCKTATDLGRERYFQGCGMIDVLRAIQSV